MQNFSIHSKYKYIRPLGKGGCGTVFLAQSISLGNHWAVKEITKNEKNALSIYVEPEVLKRLNHPALPRICDVYEDEDKVYIVEDYIEGTNLKDEFDKSGPFDNLKVVDWGIQLCGVLDYLHNQSPNPIIYGDMKPHNIILTKEGYIKLIDFGISVITHENDQLEEENTVFIGTKGYAAPEQFEGAKISVQTDIYSLGITMIQLLTGINPLINGMRNIPSEDTYDFTKKIKGKIPEPLWDILSKCIFTKPEKRYQTALELMSEFKQYSLRCFMPPGVDLLKGREPRGLAKIIAFCGKGGVGVSTITLATAEFISKEGQKVCIIDLSENNGLWDKFRKGNEGHSGSMNINLSSSLDYISLHSHTLKNDSPDCNDTNTCILNIQKCLCEVRDKYTYIFIDLNINWFLILYPYLNHAFIVTDMNPYNLEGILVQIANETGTSNINMEINAINASTYQSYLNVSIIINKFHKGEVTSKSLVRNIILSIPELLSNKYLTSNLKIFEVSYQQDIIFKWIYSFFGDSLSFLKLEKTVFGEDIKKVLEAISIHKSKKGYMQRLTRFIGVSENRENYDI